MAHIGKRTIQRLTRLVPFPQPSFQPTRHPVVLMHGFGLIAAFRGGGHLHDEAMSLRKHGVRAYAPNVSPYHTVPARADMWRDRLRTILAETRADAVNLIAHSMGGLDARYLIRELDMHHQVASLVTVSTPHRGSALADIALEQPERVRTLITDAAQWASDAAMEGTPSDFRRAVEDLSPAYVTGTFNPAVPDHPSVTYWSYAGRAGKGTGIPINPLLMPANLMMYTREGPNDGIVGASSARWGVFRGLIEADHAQQIGIGRSIGSRFDSTKFYRDVVAELAKAGF